MKTQFVKCNKTLFMQDFAGGEQVFTAGKIYAVSPEKPYKKGRRFKIEIDDQFEPHYISGEWISHFKLVTKKSDLMEEKPQIIDMVVSAGIPSTESRINKEMKTLLEEELDYIKNWEEIISKRNMGRINMITIQMRERIEFIEMTLDKANKNKCQHFN